MTHTEVSKKILDGKLIRIEIDVEDNLVRSVKITGDFFLFPENTLEEIENSIIESALPLDKEELTTRIKNVLRFNEAELVGASPEDISLLVEEATK